MVSDGTDEVASGAPEQPDDADRLEVVFAEVEKRCAEQPGSTLDYPFGTDAAVYKVGGKMFALLSQQRDPEWLSLKLPPDLILRLREAHPGSVLPGYYLNKTHWNTFVLDGVLPDDEIIALLDQSYALVCSSLPKRLRPQ